MCLLLLLCIWACRAALLKRQVSAVSASCGYDVLWHTCAVAVVHGASAAVRHGFSPLPAACLSCLMVYAHDGTA